MSRYRICSPRIFAALLLLAGVSVAPTFSFAQDDGLSFENAQARTAYARRQMETMRRELRDAEAREESALRAVDDFKKRYEQAQRDVEEATKARQSAEEQYAQSRERWSQESERLKRIHQNRQ